MKFIIKMTMKTITQPFGKQEATQNMKSLKLKNRKVKKYEENS